MNPTVDAVFAFANCLILVGRAPAGQPFDQVEIRGQAAHDFAETDCTARYPAADGGVAGRVGVAQVEDRSGYACRCPLAVDFAKTVAEFPSGYTLRLKSGERLVHEHPCDIQSVLSDHAARYADPLRALASEAMDFDHRWAILLRGILDGRHATTTLLGHVDHHRTIAESALLVHGWVANAAVAKLFFLLDGARVALTGDDAFFSRRPDVESHLRDSGLVARTALHGFTLLALVNGKQHDLLIAAFDDADVEWLVPESRATRSGTWRELLMDIASFGVENFPKPVPLAERLQSILKNVPAPRTGHTLTEYKKVAARPELSIVIPFYRDDFFLVDHIASQRRAPANVEWLFVCDDPALLPGMMSVLQNRRGSLQQATRLIGLDRNAGFAVANNFGVRCAEGEYIAFMNSDIYWNSFEPIAHAIGLLRDDDGIGAVGFTLHYEDGMLQHAGMSIEAAPEFDGLALCLHKGKGLQSPFSSKDDLSSREVEAVTAALLIVRRSDFADRVFDEGYISGDFEDADLCLDLRRRGKRIVLVECAGLFHLERQSLRGDATHHIFTYVNCVRFNEKWRPGESARS